MADNLWMQAAFSMAKLAEAQQFRDEIAAHHKRDRASRARRRQERRRLSAVGPILGSDARDLSSASDSCIEGSKARASLGRRLLSVKGQFLRGQRRPDRVDFRHHPLRAVPQQLKKSLPECGSRLDRRA
ncbi:MAG: hypothetical protein KDK78_02040 [Chlamydiia bacterium]|nr:hypothetical protein [Chlamydiia bacterium]